MDEKVHEVWYKPAYQTEQGKKVLQRKLDNGLRILVHSHSHSEIACVPTQNCKLMTKGDTI